MIKGSASGVVEQRLKEYRENNSNDRVLVINDVDLTLLKKRGWSNGWYRNCESDESNVGFMIIDSLHEYGVRVLD